MNRFHGNHSNDGGSTLGDEPAARRASFTFSAAAASVAVEPVNAYLRARVLAASPEQLRLMLLEGALRFARQGADGLRRRNFERSFNGIHQCQNILMELISALKPEVAPELCRNLAALYTFMYRRLIDASMERDAAVVDEVVKLLEYEHETWLLLLERLEQERSQTLRDGELKTGAGDVAAFGLVAASGASADPRDDASAAASPLKFPAPPPTYRPNPLANPIRPPASSSSSSGTTLSLQG